MVEADVYKTRLAGTQISTVGDHSDAVEVVHPSHPPATMVLQCGVNAMGKHCMAE